ncbi:MAG TPA: hypothetical protein VE443_06645 [Beijerinckiaceae bacterium]|nr:hypothetical protein [Beijerinckiaceae bacterium]
MSAMSSKPCEQDIKCPDEIVSVRVQRPDALAQGTAIDRRQTIHRHNVLPSLNCDQWPDAFEGRKTVLPMEWGDDDRFYSAGVGVLKNDHKLTVAPVRAQERAHAIHGELVHQNRR